MALKKSIFLKAFLITAGMFLIIMLANVQISKEREKVVIDEMEKVLEDYKELQTIALLSDIFGDEMTCLAFQKQLSQMDKSIWEAAKKMDKYREVTKEFMDDPFYVEQKIKFNRNQAMYFAMLKNMKKKCDVNQTIILYFYKKKSDCPMCDAQSFVLTDINKEIDPEISVFSFDINLDISSVNTLAQYHEVEQYPCIIIEDAKYCGFMNKNTLIDALCENSNVTVCIEE